VPKASFVDEMILTVYFVPELILGMIKKKRLMLYNMSETFLIEKIDQRRC